MTSDELRSTDGTIFSDLTLLRTARSYEFATARAEDGSLRVMKSLRGDDLAAFGPVIRNELAALAVKSDRLPADGRVFSVDGPRGLEKLVSYRWVDGIPLRVLVGSEHRGGLPLPALLVVLRDVAQALSDLHGAGLVHPCLSPDHVIVEPDGRAVLIGLGNVVSKGSRGPDIKTGVDEVFSAPEVRDELSGRLNVPRADVYGFGLLASYAATGERPTGSVHAPLTRAAFDRLAQLPEGVSFLLARCLQPLQKNRLGSMRQILPLLENPESLPAVNTPGFGPLALIAPWLQDDGPGSLRVGHLSAGPLVDRPRARDPVAGNPMAPRDPQVEERRWGAAIVSLAIVAATLYIVIRSIFGL
jgi:serine/threonine protein kinase